MNEDEGEEWVEDGREEGRDDGRDEGRALMAAASWALTSCRWRSNVSSTCRDEHKITRELWADRLGMSSGMSYLGHLLVDVFVGLLELLLGFCAQLLLAVQLLCKLRRALSLLVQHLLDALSLLNFI